MRGIRDRLPGDAAAFASALIAAAVLTLAAVAAGAASPKLLGDTMDAQVVVRGVEGMAAFDATVIYSTEVLSPTGVAFGPFLPDDSNPLGPDYVAAGRVTFGSFNSHGGTVDGGGVVATVRFAVIGGGEPMLALDEGSTAAYDSEGARLAAEFSVEEASGALYLPGLINRGSPLR